jgi:transposase
MLNLNATTVIYIAIQPIDFRKGIDGLIGLCRQKLQQDPFSGAIFVFRNKPLRSIKMLAYDGQGFWLMSKRLSEGRFQWWPNSPEELSQCHAQQLQTLLWNGNPESAQYLAAWKEVG